MTKCKLLSLDTSSSETGWAIFIDGKTKPKRYGVLKIKKKKNDDESPVIKMGREISKLVIKEKPDILVIEDLNVMNNITTAKVLSKIIGIAIGCSFMTGTDTYTIVYEPNHWRRLIAETYGDGKYPKKRIDCKQWDIEITNKILKTGLENFIDNDNICDAILIGLAYISEFSE